MYLSPRDFNERYPLHEVIGSGTYGKVYSSIEGIAVKKQRWDEYEFFRELAILSQFRHPNICDLKAVTIHENKSYLALERGVNLKESTLTDREIISDLTSALAFLKVNHLFHGDLKTTNVVVVGPSNPRAVLIDFGLSRVTDTFKHEGRVEDMVTGVSYTLSFRDPSYYSKTKNSIRCESYSLATTMYYLRHKEHSFDVEMPYYITPEMFRDAGIVEDDVIDFLMECQAPLDVRKDIEELLRHPAIDQSRVTIPTRVTRLSYMSRDPSREILDLMVTKAKALEISFESLCGAVDLLFRYSQREPSSPEIGLASLLIAANIYNEDQIYAHNIFGRNINIDAIVKVLVALDFCVISDHSFYCIRSPEEALATLRSFYSTTFDSSKRQSSGDHETVSRSFSIQEIERIPIVECTVEDYERIPVNECRVDYEKNPINDLESGMFEKIGLISSRGFLREVPDDEAFDIFEMLVANAIASKSYEMIRRVVAFDTTNLTLSNIEYFRDHNPFKMSSVDVPPTIPTFLDRLEAFAKYQPVSNKKYSVFEKTDMNAVYRCEATSHAAAVLSFLREGCEDFVPPSKTLGVWITEWFKELSSQKYFIGAY
jgi:serine/threonine protein kinase